MDSFKAKVMQGESVDDLFFELPEEFAKAHDWLEGDRLEWSVEGGRATLRNLDKDERGREGAGKPAPMPLFIVEELVTHRVRHAIRARCAQDAVDEVAMGKSEEFDQNHVGSQVLGARQVDVSEYLASFEVPADPDLKRVFIQSIDYEADALRRLG